MCERTIYVLLTCQGMPTEQVDASTLDFTNIEEGFGGEDIYTFTCPKCDETHKSIAFST